MAALVLLGALAGCGGGTPYVLADYHARPGNRVEVCYDELKTNLDEARALADTVCAETYRVASFQLSQRSQCNWQTPDIALFYCVKPPAAPQKSAPAAPAPAGGS